MVLPASQAVGDRNGRTRLHRICRVRHHASDRRKDRHARSGSPYQSVELVALLAPGVAVIVVPSLLPEAWLILQQQLHSVEPFSRLPEVQMRDEQTGRTPVQRPEVL